MAYIIHGKHLRRELRWCLRYVDGRHDKEDCDTMVERAQLRRLRQFGPRFTRKCGVRPGQRTAGCPVDHLDDSSEDKESSYDSIKREPPSMSFAPVATEPLLVLASAIPTYTDIFIELLFGGSTYKVPLDTESVVTLLSGVRFPPGTVPGYGPLQAADSVVQDASGRALPFMGQVLREAETESARVTARFSRELPVDAIIELDALHALGLILFPAGCRGVIAGIRDARGKVKPVRRLYMKPVAFAAIILPFMGQQQLPSRSPTACGTLALCVQPRLTWKTRLCACMIR